MQSNFTSPLLRFGRGVAVLGLSMAVALGTSMTVRAFLHKSPEEWVCSEFCRTAQESERVRSLERTFREGCSPQCRRKCAAEGRLRDLVMRSREVGTELRAALEEAARARAEAEATVLEHVYAVAAALPEDRRESYLRSVLPNLAGCCSAE